MKFGQNLAHLSIPEWKVYNLEYNDLKALIRELTNSKSSDLSLLHQKFVDNFDYLNLFVMTKAGELDRRIKMDSRKFSRIKHSNDENIASQLARLNTLHYDVINEISIEARKLTKFIVVQKIAVKKIFKKLTKHYHDRTASKAFVTVLTQYLQSNPYSFHSFDLSKLTADLLFLLNKIDAELRYLLEYIHKKRTFTDHNNFKTSTSKSPVRSLRSLTLSDYAGLDDLNVDASFGAADQVAMFDLITTLKKNFTVHSLVPKDVASCSDLRLTLDVYLSIPKVSALCRASIIYLTHPNVPNPSWIMSYEELQLSVIMAFTGGLRKYSYCALLHNMVSIILAYLNEKDPEAKDSLKQKVSGYISCGGLSSMTRTTLYFILNCNLSPSLQTVFDRSRYFLSHKPSQHEDSSVMEARVSALTEGSIEAPSASIDKKVYEDSFYMILDEKIFTSNTIASEISFDTTQLDPFPFNSFSICSNDLHLHAFEDQLITEIHDNVLQSKPRFSALKELPCKIRNLFKSALIHAFKDFSMLDYMNSCYFNEIPKNPNNHYSRLLNLNLLKNYENVEISIKRQTLDKTLIQSKSNLILHRQESCISLLQSKDPTVVSTTPLTNLTATVKSLVASPYSKSYVIPSTDYPNPRISELENYSEENVSEDGYLLYLGFQNDLHDNIFSRIMLAFVKIKYRTLRAFWAFHLVDQQDGRWSKFKESKSFHACNEADYDSIHEDPSFFSNRNDYQIQFLQDYDCVVSFLAFSLCFSSVFVTAINLGILCSLRNLQGRLKMLDNPILVILIFIGFLFALIFSMAGVHLYFQQFRTPPMLFSCVMWISLVFVNLTIMWSIAQMITR